MRAYMRAYVHMYVHVCHAQECQFALTCICARSGTHVSCTDVQGCLAMEDREQWRFLTMEDAEDSTAGPPQRTCFAELSAECSRRLATLRRESNKVNVQKEPKRQEEIQLKWKKKHIVESLHKPGTCCGESSQTRYTLSCLIQPMSFLGSLARRGVRRHVHV